MELVTLTVLLGGGGVLVALWAPAPDAFEPEGRSGRPALVDNRVVVPVGGIVRLQTTAADVIHSWAVPAFGVKLDAVPGRLNETWFKVLRPGIYYGMCSELCGGNHNYMPIAVEAISKEKFAEWVAKARKNEDFEQIEGKPAKASVKPDAKTPSQTKKLAASKTAAQ